MIVEIRGYTRDLGKVIRTLELSPFDIPRKDDVLHISNGEIYSVHHVVWVYSEVDGTLIHVHLMV